MDNSNEGFLRQSSSVSTNVTSTLEVFLNDMRYINPRFTYCRSVSVNINVDAVTDDEYWQVTYRSSEMLVH